MRRPPTATLSAPWISGALLLVLATALAGCGGSASAKPQAAVALSSPAIAGGNIPARYTCDGANTPPPLRWGALPSGTTEVALFAVGLTARHTWDSVEWAIAGVKPGLHALNPGQLPAGAFVVEASDGKRGYSICPPKGQTEPG